MKNRNLKYARIALLALTMVSVGCANVAAQSGNQINTVSNQLDSYNVQWDTPGPTSAQSMPIGNGDIGLNVWVEQNGDLAFYISKTDAWGGELDAQKDPWMKQGGVLMKLGAIHVSVSPNPLAKSASFKQILKLGGGEILVQEGEGKAAVKLRVWVDANHPVIRVEAQSGNPVTVNVKLDNWRAGQTDTVLDAQKNQIAWYHHNSTTTDPHLANLTFGAIVKGKGLVSKDASTLQSGKVSSQLISIYPLTAVAGNGKEWLSKLEKQSAGIEKLALEQTRTAHQKWWQQFWNRSHIFLHGDEQEIGRASCRERVYGLV